jgi:hypothetical protein
MIDSLSTVSTSKIQVNIGNGSLPINSYNQVDPASTTVLSVTGNTRPGTVGEEVEIYDDSAVISINGERFFIESIANAGTSSESWTISPALSSATASSPTVRCIGVKKGEEKTINIRDLSKPIRFGVNFFGSTMYLEILTEGTTNNMPISIKNIQLF